MSRRVSAEKREHIPDLKYNDLLIARFVNSLMSSGKKSVAEKIFYGCLQTIADKTKQDPIEIFRKAVDNVKPVLEVKSRRVGGANYQVPQEVRNDRKTSLAIRWLIEAARKRSNKEFHTFDEKLAAELLDAAATQGEAVKKKEIMHKQAEANKAFTHFRW